MCVRIIMHHPERCGHRAVHIECCGATFIPKSCQSSECVMEYPVMREIKVNVGWECEDCDLYLDDRIRRMAYASLARASMYETEAILSAIATISAGTTSRLPEIVGLTSANGNVCPSIPGLPSLNSQPPVMRKIFSDKGTTYTAYGHINPQEENPNQSGPEKLFEDSVRAAKVEDTCITSETSQPSIWLRQAKSCHEDSFAITRPHGIKMPPPATLDVRTEFVGMGQAEDRGQSTDRRTIFKALRATSMELRSRRLTRRYALVAKRK